MPVKFTTPYGKRAVPSKADELPPFLSSELGNIQRAIVDGLSSGPGVPNDLSGTDGNFYFRTDTPGAAGQMIYQKVAGVWTPIV